MIKVKKKIKVLIIDDSALVRNILSQGLSRDPGIEVVGTAPDVYVGRDKIVKLSPDVLTLDIEMPKMDGIEFLKRLMPQYPLPVVVVSSLTKHGKKTTLDALDAGAVDFVPKPSSDLSRSLSAMMVELATKIKLASTANVSHWKNRTASQRPIPGSISKALAASTDKVIAIGASTGGTEAIKNVICNLPPTTPGIVIVQHMPPGFTKLFSQRLNQLSLMEVKEAETNDRIMNGRILIAPGDQHMKVIRSGGIYRVVCEDGEKVCGHKPSVDVLMKSVAEYVGGNAYGIMLTGMGKDGAEGRRLMKENGAYNIAQDEKSCTVFGMPKAALENNAVDIVISLDAIPDHIIKTIKNKL